MATPDPPTQRETSAERNDLRNIVWDEFKRRAMDDLDLRRKIEAVGVFHFLDVVDAAVDVVLATELRSRGR